MTIPGGGNGDIPEEAREEGRRRLAEGLRAGIYCRISVASIGDTTKTDDQARICNDLAGRLGWDVVDIYSDDSKSAWQPNRKRKEWDRMLGDVESGRINAIVTYHGDRLVRRQEDLSALLKLAKSKGVRLASPTGTRDLDSDDDQFILEIECSMAKRESANTSRRRKQQYERWRREGRTRPGGKGGRAYGFASDSMTLFPPDRCDVATRRELGEADVIREMAARVLAGESTNRIAREMTARGERTSTGGPMSQEFVRRLLARPRYAGLMPDGESAAAWEPVLDRETWERVRLKLDARASSNPAPTSTRRWLLSGIAICGTCGRLLQIGVTSHGANGRGYPGYSCVKGCVRRSAVHLDTYVIVRTVGRLANPLNPEPDGPALPDSAPEWAALASERAETEQLAQDYAASPGRLRLLVARLDSIDRRMAELREREAGDARSRLIAAHQGITVTEFRAQPLAVQRALVAACFRITVLPASKRGPGFRTEDVRLEPL